MPYYQQLVIAFVNAPADHLAKLFQRYARTIINGGGVMRGIENQGIRKFPSRFRSRFAAPEGGRQHWEGRYITTHVDASPLLLKDAERVLRTDDYVLRFFNMKPAAYSNSVNSRLMNNPFRPGTTKFNRYPRQKRDSDGEIILEKEDIDIGL